MDDATLLLQGRLPAIPALGLASAALLVLCLILLAWRSRNGFDSLGGGMGSIISLKQQSGRAATPAVDEKPAIRILYGTQTGTAERFAKQLRTALASRYGAQVGFVIQDIEDYKWEASLPEEGAVVFLMATYGDGEPTDSAADFYSWLVQAAEDANNGIGDDAMLKGLSFAVFGLGNKQYEHFAAVGKRLQKALASLGAAPVCRRGDGDDDDDIDADFEAWQADLLSALDLSPIVPDPKDGDQLKAERRMSMSAEAVAAYEVLLVTGVEADVAMQLGSNGTGADSHNPYRAPLGTVRELHQKGSDRSCLHAELDISSSQVQYDTGDHVAVVPENSPQTVAAAAAALGQPLDLVFSLTLPSGNPQQLRAPFPGPISLRSALARHADMLAPVRRAALGALAAFASDPEQAERLRHLAAPEGKADFQAWAVAPGRTLLEAMQEFPSAKPALGAFFGSIAERVQPRYYSISSSPKAHPGAVHITCSVVRERKGTGRLHLGVASTWLGRLPPGAEVPMWVRKSTFKLPASLESPLVMIGPGTGLAPFRGFLQERQAAKDRGQALGQAMLFFGCRKAKQDFIYEDELRAFQRSGALTSLSCAFSRDSAEKDYVQHRLTAQAGEVWTALHQGGGSLYVCGDAKHMARDVHRALASIVSQQKGCSEADAESWLSQLADSGRYQRDVW